MKEKKKREHLNILEAKEVEVTKKKKKKLKASIVTTNTTYSTIFWTIARRNKTTPNQTRAI